MLSLVVLLSVGELGVGVAAHTGGGGCTAVFKGTGFTGSMAAGTVFDAATLLREAGVGVSAAWISGEAEVEVSSRPGVVDAGVGGGAGAFLFLCWLSEPRPI